MFLIILVWLAQLAAAIVFAFYKMEGDLGSALKRLGARLTAIALSTPALWALAAGVVLFTWIGMTATTELTVAGAEELRELLPQGHEGDGERIPDLPVRIFALISAALQLIALLAILIGNLFERVPDMVFGSAKLATPEHAQAQGLIGETGIRLGTLRNPDPAARAKELKRGIRRPLHYIGERHMLIVAPTRAGKGVSFIIPNLLVADRSVLVIDPKAENVRITYDRRASFGKTYVLDPWGISGKPGARFNPLDMLTPDSPTLIEDAMLIADALVIHEGSENSFWSDEAKGLIFGFLIHLATAPSEEGRRHLGRLRDILCSTPDEMTEIGLAMVESAHSVVVSSAARFISKSENERSGVLSTAQSNTHFLESVSLQASMTESDFRFSDLKGEAPVSVFIVLPVDRLSTYSRWLRMLIALGIADIARSPAKPPKPVLFLLDEFAALGRLAIVETAYSLLAGVGLQIASVIQDLGQIRRLYAQSWSTFVANSILMTFATRDVETAEYFSKMAGTTTATVRSASSSSSGQGGSSSMSLTPTQRTLLLPDEIMRMDSKAALLFIEGSDPVVADRVLWFEDERLKALAEGRAGP